MLHTFLLVGMVATAVVPDSTGREQTLAEVHVAARRDAAHTLGGAPTHVVTAAEIEQRGAVGLTEVLQTMAGVSVKDYGGIGGLKTVNLRNFGAQHTGVMVDGIIASDAMNGQVDIGRYNLDNAGSVVVDVAGATSIFRPARLAGYVGSVALASRPMRHEDRRADGTVQLRSASFGTWNPYARFRSNVGSRWALGAWGDYVHSRGDYPFVLKNGQLVTDERRLNSQVERFNSEVKAEGNIGRGGTLRLTTSLYDSSRGLPGSVVLYTQHPTEHLWDRTWSTSALYESRLAGAAGDSCGWRLRASLAYTNAWNRYVDSDAAKPVPEDDRYRQQTLAGSVVALWQVRPEWSLSVAEDVDVAHLWSSMPEAVMPTRETSFTALAGKFQNERLTATATLLGLVATEQTQVGEPSPTRCRACPSASLSFRVLSEHDWRVRASYKETYRLPTFNDLYYLRVGNRNLQPERARQTNVGTTYAADCGDWHLLFTADTYYNNVRDKIVAIPTMFVWHMRNVGRVNMTGVDVTASAAGPVAPWLTMYASANYSWQRALDVTDRTAKNFRHQIPYTPRHVGSGVVTCQLPWLTLSYTLQAVGERYSLAQNTAAYRIEPYTDHSLSANRTFVFGGSARCHGAACNRSTVWRLHISAEALNLGGRNYEVVKYYPMPGRQWRATLRLSF